MIGGDHIYNDRKLLVKITLLTHILTFICKIYKIDKIELIITMFNSEFYKKFMEDERMYIRNPLENINEFTKELINDFGFDMLTYEEWHKTYLIDTIGDKLGGELYEYRK